MPYKTVKKKKKYETINLSTGRVLAKKTTKDKSQKQIRLLNAIEHNPKFKPRHK